MVALGLSLGLMAACSDSDSPDVPKTATGSLEQLAAKAKCAPDMATDAAELRQANCTTKDGRYVLATFSTDRGQREWINGAKDYGGTYLVGRKWVAVGEDKVVTALRGRLGGTVEEGSQHHSGSSGSRGSEPDHSGHRAS
ncbi:lipoprotein [Streptomyces beijiangensis]